jgi:hypothetical protein
VSYSDKNFNQVLGCCNTFESFHIFVNIVGWDSIVSIGTRYGLDSSGIESRWGGGDFQQLSVPTLGPTQPPVHGY